jgi:hypothetical protein
LSVRFARVRNFSLELFVEIILIFITRKDSQASGVDFKVILKYNELVEKIKK